MSTCSQSAWGFSVAVQHRRGATLPFPSLRTQAVDRPEITLIHPTSPEELAATREIFVEYAGTLDVDLDFQGFEEELAELPGEYAAPRGNQAGAAGSAGR